jgi:hypothetical protein
VNILDRNEKFKTRMSEEIEHPHWNCRFHPTDGWHETGCPHKEWSKEQLQRALVLAKASNLIDFEFGENLNNINWGNPDAKDNLLAIPL